MSFVIPSSRDSSGRCKYSLFLYSLFDPHSARYLLPLSFSLSLSSHSPYPTAPHTLTSDDSFFPHVTSSMQKLRRLFLDIAIIFHFKSLSTRSNSVPCQPKLRNAVLFTIFYQHFFQIIIGAFMISLSLHLSCEYLDHFYRGKTDKYMNNRYGNSRAASIVIIGCLLFAGDWLVEARGGKDSG